MRHYKKIPTAGLDGTRENKLRQYIFMIKVNAFLILKNTKISHTPILQNKTNNLLYNNLFFVCHFKYKI